MQLTLWCKRRILSLLVLAWVGWVMTGVTLLANTYALVIGVDRYQHITPLRGAVNDAIDIASAISTLKPKELKLLLDEKVTRSAVLNTWESYLDLAEPGDTIIVTFAGHGASEPAHYPSSEADGRDETFLLAGFDRSGEGAAERIRDDEIAELIGRRPDVSHILVADSCHSGTAIRSTQYDLGYRFYTLDGISDDPLPPPPPPSANMTTDTNPGLGNSVFFAAVGDDELAPEINIDGSVRGALSYAFANGLRGEADRDQNGVVTKGELEVHIRRQVKSLLNGRQKPRVSPAGEVNKPLFNTYATLKREDSAFSKPFASLDLIPVSVVGNEEIAPFGSDMLSGIQTVSEPMQGGIVVDFAKEEINNATGDLLRRFSREVGFDWRRQTQALVDKMRIVNTIASRSIESTIDVSFPFGDTLYFEDDGLNILITGRTTSHVTVLNLSAEGRLQWLYPRYAPIDADSGFDDPAKLDPNEVLSFDAFVVPPFGTEHVIVIETAAPHDAVRRAAKRFDGSNKLDLFWREMNISLADVPHAVGIHSYVTAEK